MLCFRKVCASSVFTNVSQTVVLEDKTERNILYVDLTAPDISELCIEQVGLRVLVSQLLQSLKPPISLMSRPCV